MTHDELITALERYPDDMRVMTWSEGEPDPVRIESVGAGVVDGREVILLKLSSVRVSWDYPEEKR